MCSLYSGWTYPASVPERGRDDKHHPEAACDLGRAVSMVGPDSSSILYPFAAWCAPQSITNSSAPPSLEYINHASIQWVPPAKSAWYFHIILGQTTLPRRYCGKREGRMHTQTQTWLSSLVIMSGMKIVPWKIIGITEKYKMLLRSPVHRRGLLRPPAPLLGPKSFPLQTGNLPEIKGFT